MSESSDTVRWFVQPGTLGAAEDLDWAMDTLGTFRSRAADGAPTSDLIRVYIPEPSVAFGQRDSRLPGFQAAAAVSRSHGFTPLVRRAGGRAAAYHPGCVVVDHLAVEADAARRQQSRFAEFAELFVRAFTRMAVESAVGEIPGEYCPGEFSVHGQTTDHPVKLAGSAQRVVRGAWLFSTHVVISNAGPLRGVLTEVYRELGLEMDPRTVGAAEDVHPGADVAGFVAALRAEYESWAGAQGRIVVDIADQSVVIGGRPPSRD